MPALPQPALHAKLRAGLPAGTVFDSADATHPAELTVPSIGATRIYLWTITHIDSPDRPPDEYKIQLILPGQGRDERGQLVLQMRPTFLLGYSPEFGVFVGWEARLHEHFAFSSAKQVKESTLEAARRTGWEVAPLRRSATGLEVRVAFSPANLMRYLQLSIAADSQGLKGSDREHQFLVGTPNFGPVAIDAGIPAETAVRRLRRRLLVSRVERNARFGPLIKDQYGYGCAVCGKQLSMVEGAHIIPASAENSEDEVWNGVAMCPNHHKLFDASTLVVLPDLQIRIDDDAVAFFRESGMERGVDDELEAFRDARITPPRFFHNDSVLRAKMAEALHWRAHLSALSA